MFRQQIPECTCQLFSPSTFHAPKFRSPPAQLNRQQVRSKRSLKSQSNSRIKHLSQHNQLQEKVTQLSNKKIHFQNSPKELGRAPSNTFQIKPPVITLKMKKTDTLVKIAKENQPISFHALQSHNRIYSPAHYQSDMFRPIFERLGGHFRGVQVQERVINLSPRQKPRIENINCQSAGTTLAGSVAPSMEEQIDNKPTIYSHEPKNDLPHSKNFGSGHENLDKFGCSGAEVEIDLNGIGALRLSEMMTKDECESVYDGDKTLNSEKVQESRVLISCKKLMQEKKNGFLQASDQNRLFDFYRESSERNKRSGIFQKLNLVKPNPN